jgi:acyl-CoA thioesterase FadM
MARQLQLLRTLLAPGPPVPGRDLLAPSVTRMRVGPGDLDLNLHVNNGVYLQMMDVARFRHIAEVGGMRPLRDLGWFPVVAASSMTYRRSLRLGDPFAITTRVVGWDPRMIYMEQVFARRGDHCARGLVAGRFLARPTGERIPAPDVVATLGGDPESPPLPDEVARWARAVGVAHRGAGA